MKKYIVFTLAFGALFLKGFSQKEVPLPDIMNPNSIVIDNQQIYIVQEVNVFIYSLKDFSLINKFGKAGEGPREFKKVPQPWIPSISLYLAGDKLMINSVGKITFFSRKGDFIKEKPLSRFGVASRLIPLKSNYILMEYTIEKKTSVVAVNLVDQNLSSKTKKRLCNVTFPQQTGKKRNPILMAKMLTYLDRYASDDYLVLPVNEAGDFKIFNGNGEELQSFTPQYTRVDITDQMRKNLDDFFCNDVRYKRLYLLDKGRNLVTFGDHLPLFNHYRLTEDKIYIISSYREKGKYETFIYDYQGNLLRKIFIPLVNQDIFDVSPFGIKNNKIYQLIWNEEEEEIRLRITEL